MDTNDLWIAPIAIVQGAVMLTTDQDFDHALHQVHVRIERVEGSALLGA